VLDLFHIDHGGRCTEHGEIVRHQRNVAAVDLGEAGNLAIGRRLVFDRRLVAAREAAGFDERAFIDQVVDALAGIEMALRLALGQLLRPAHSEHFIGFLFVFFEQFFKCHGKSFGNIETAQKARCRADILGQHSRQVRASAASWT